MNDFEKHLRAIFDKNTTLRNPTDVGRNLYAVVTGNIRAKILLDTHI